MKAVFNAVNANEAETLLTKLATYHHRSNPKLADWLEANAPEGLRVFSFYEPHRCLLRTTNGLERGDQEGKRRARVGRMFPDEASCLRLGACRFDGD